FHDRQPLERALYLERTSHAQSCTQVGRTARHAATEEVDLTAVHLGVAGKGVEQRRLAGAVGPDEAEDGAFVELQRDVVDGDEAAELYGYAFSFQRSWHSRIASSPRVFRVRP